MAADDDLLGGDAAGDARLLADDDVGSLDVALNLAVDLHLALGDEVAVDHQVGTDDGRGVALRAAGNAQGPGGGPGCGRNTSHRSCQARADLRRLRVGSLEIRQHKRTPLL
ncbi:MAG: hypothetical protein WDN31_09425 [Hyphomicrobium sp.]